ncbi:MAG TPA: hypothetical protein PK047_13105 [Saprospiraceae bacterium]|nr:hypothetical protein [Saprospiraceae bacterium]HRO09798.1 hypothetical protein [Saprospiraceae bacterium]HRP43052.1 hypothetical protein [Saprospiraceae bacterium]
MKKSNTFMAKIGYLLIFIMIFSCQSRDKNPPKEENKNALALTLIDSTSVDTFEALTTLEEITMLENENTNPGLQAYDKLYFGMKKNEVNKLNKSRQKIGSYSYNFSYVFNGAGELYSIVIRSDPEKTLYYEQRLQPKYSNLCRVIAEKYGKKSGCGLLPSIFDVMNAQRYKMVGWQEGEKKINLYLRFVALDVYNVECSITHDTMEKAENQRLYKLKNKHIIESAEKF